MASQVFLTGTASAWGHGQLVDGVYGRHEGSWAIFPTDVPG
jgi:hypothetical protein